jgi:hypothetical protein
MTAAVMRPVAAGMWAGVVRGQASSRWLQPCYWGVAARGASAAAGDAGCRISERSITRQLRAVSGGVSARLERTGQRSCSPAFSGISQAAANVLPSFPSMRQIQPPRPRSRRSRSRAPARWSRPRRQRARQKLCGSYRPKLWSAPTVPTGLVSSLILLPH